MTVLIDDHVLARLLTESLTDADLAAIDGDDLTTTGCWYYRLCHAVRSPTITGSLSGLFASLPGPSQHRANAVLVELPDEIGLASFRALVPTMSDLVERHPLNLLSLEVLAAATSTPSVVVIDQSNQRGPLTPALVAEGVELRLV
ncbi:MAG: hypothetical protein M3471_07150 [Actinomycetota bacterium]|nr:hypothetical protein [Actinomycetota bacterium]